MHTQIKQEPAQVHEALTETSPDVHWLGLLNMDGILDMRGDEGTEEKRSYPLRTPTVSFDKNLKFTSNNKIILS